MGFWSRTLLSTALLLVLLCGTSSWADQKSSSPRPDPGATHERLDHALRDVINRGADLYNAGDRQACYCLFEGALLVAKVQLDSFPELQKEIDRRLTDAENLANPGARAFALRKTVDDVRKALKSKPATPDAPKPGESK